MLQQIREKSRGVFGWVLMGAIIFVLTLFGFGAFTAFVSSEPSVARVGDAEITLSELEQGIDRQRRQLIARMGADADPAALDDERLAGEVLANLIERTLLLEGARQGNLTLSEETLDQIIVGMDEFRTGGRFDPDQFRFALANAGMTPTSFRRALRDDMVIEQLAVGLGDSAFVTEPELRNMAALIQQRRDLAWLEFAPEAFEGDVEFDEDALRAFHVDNRERYREPEQVRVAYVELLQDALLDQVEISEAALRGAYERELEELQAEAERSASHILLEVGEARTEAEAMELARGLRVRIAEGESFSDLAQEYSDDRASAEVGGELGPVEPGAFAEPFEDALFALSEAGEVSEPVRTEFGVHLIRLESIEAAEPPDFDALRDELEARLRQQRVADLFVERRQELDALAFESDDLEAPAEALDLEIREAGPFTRDGGDGIWSRSSVLQAAFSTEVLEEGFNSEAIEVDDGRVIVLRVTEHLPARDPDFSEVAARVEEDLVQAEARQLAREAGERALERLQQGSSTEAVADRHGLTWERREEVQRHQTDVAPRQVLETAFRLPRPATEGRSLTTTSLRDGRMAVVLVTRVRPGELDELTDSERQQLSMALRMELGDREFSGYREALRQALGVEQLRDYDADDFDL